MSYPGPPEYGHDFADMEVLGAEATADYCYSHQNFCDPNKPAAATFSNPNHNNQEQQ